MFTVQYKSNRKQQNMERPMNNNIDKAIEAIKSINPTDRTVIEQEALEALLKAKQDIKDIDGNIIVRENLMSDPNYTPYCGGEDCHKGNPRTVWDADTEQFVCGCGWVSSFPEYFIKGYKAKQDREDALKLLKKYEEWEAGIISDNRCWEPEGMASLPRLTQELYDTMIELQSERNKLIKQLSE